MQSIAIQHSIPGRIRLKIPSIRHNASQAEDCIRHFQNQDGVLTAHSNIKAASLIVRYDPKAVSAQDILDDLSKKSSVALPVPRQNQGSFRTIQQTKNADSAPSVRSAFVRFLGLSLLTGIVFVRETILKRPMAQVLFSPLGLTVSLAAVPMLTRGVRSLRQKKIRLESFLGGSILAAVVAGESVAALEILWISSGGDLLQAWVNARSRRAIRDILKITAKDTYILQNDVEVSIPVEQVQAGDIVVLHTGEKVAVDGEVIKGQAMVDEAPITGRAEPAAKSPDDTVFAGTFVQQGVIHVQAREVGDRTYLARILRMVEESLDKKAPVEGVADRLAQKLIKVGFAVTAGTLILTRSPWRTFSVMLVMACPCSTVLAASTAVSAALNAAARRHILIKGGRYLEEAGQAEVICFDKTGTLTSKEPELCELHTFNGISEERLLQLAYSTEMHNSHPLAQAISRTAQKQRIEPIQHEVCDYMPGMGVRATIQGQEILVGNFKLMERFEVQSDQVHAYLDQVKQQGKTLVFIARDGVLLGVASFASRERPDAAAALDSLRRDGMHTSVLVTGDSKYAAQDMARRLKFDQCHFSILPGDKAEVVRELRSKGHKVFMVGDGINDALALAEADIGVALGAEGAEVAIEAADIALVQDDLHAILYVRTLSHQTLAVIHQNFWIATGTNIAGVALGALGLLSPVMAGLVHITHTLGILANSSRLLAFQPPALEGRKESEPACRRGE
ncbi:MAG: heavy metal translocating P-type ATPase [Desulfohalobiaceae bacterium]